ncbi:MAG: hypothetical protein DRI57_09000 [Deltaproteobacteria bacterium]|nr:MAG: hypothetical protein DRI57_09000 [Deltaproteobacteria bacterium]
MQEKGHLTDLNQKYLDKLTFLIQYFGNERRERFYPFYLIFRGEKEHCRFKEALSIGKYFLDNAFLNTEDDELFFRTLKKLTEKYQAADADYWHFAENTPIPMQDYLKVIYDL